MIVVVPPLRTTAPPTTPTAIGTLFNFTLLSTRDPANPVLAWEVRRNIGVFVATASIMAKAPVAYVDFRGVVQYLYKQIESK